LPEISQVAGQSLDQVATMRKSFQFESFTLDVERLCLHGPSGQADLRRKSFDALRYLVEHASRVVTKEELIKAVWPNVTVSDESLTQCISEIRRAIGDGGLRIVKTVSRRGYLIGVPVSAGDVRAVSQMSTASAPVEPRSSAVHVPGRVAEKIDRDGLVSERKQVTVLCADVKESLELVAQRDPEEALKILDAVLKPMTRAVHRYEGTVNLVTGYGIMALFGVPLRPLVAHCHLGLAKLSRRTDKRARAQEHITTAATMYRDMALTFWLERAKAEIKVLE
jgi:DNA-binding winged helix-turn-helix (wHTH) protein